jgi:hypothetical protein
VNQSNELTSTNLPSLPTGDQQAADVQQKGGGSENQARKRGGSENLDEARAFIKKAKGLQVLEYMVSLPSRHVDKSNLTESARNYMHTAVFPILKCLETHHKNNKDEFLKKWPLQGGVTRFGKTQCNCKGPVCGIVKPN